MLVEVVLCARLYKRPPEEGEDEDEGEEGQKEEEGEGACEENKRIERPNGFNSDPHRFCHCTAHQGGISIHAAYACRMQQAGSERLSGANLSLSR